MIHYKELLSVDLRTELEKNEGRKSVKSPREHQVKAHKALSKFYNEDNKSAGILVLPTGAGKTYTAVYWLLKNIIAKKKKVLWLADQGLLLEQARNEFKDNVLEVNHTLRDKINIRIVSGSDRHGNANKIEISDDILLMTAQTAISHWEDSEETRFKKFINANAKNGDLFIVYDEAHHTPAFGRRNLLIGGSEGQNGIIETFPQTKLLGLTATPTYTNKKQGGWLWKIFKDEIVYEISKKELEDAKILANPIFKQEKTNFKLILSDSDTEKILIKHQEIPSHIIEDIAKNEDRNNFIAQYYCNNAKKLGKTIIFLDRWYQCKTVENYINKQSGKKIAASVFSYIDSNKNIDYINNRTHDENDVNIEKFRNGELEVLLNVKMLTEGVDVPDVKSVFITRDTNSTILFTQMIGRALRGEGAGGNKTTANIILFTDNWDRHIQFASSRLGGGIEDAGIRERGYRPFELMSINLLDNLQLEYENQQYETSIIDLIPDGWYVVNYTDTIEDKDEDQETVNNTSVFVENVTILDAEKGIFETFIDDFSQKYKDVLWEKEKLDIKNAEDKVKKFLSDNSFEGNKSTVVKLIQIARHIGQNGTKPIYYTFEQKADVNLCPIVLKVREENWGRDQTENYLEYQYNINTNPFFKILFPNYEDFYKAYEYEDNVYRKMKKGGINITESKQSNFSQRLASEVRKIVLSRDSYKCLCCGKKTNLQTDHIIAFKHEEPDNDDPNLFQTLCSVCNREKSANAHNYRITLYNEDKMGLEKVQLSNNEPAEYYFARLINCYYKSGVLHLDSIKAETHGNSIWRAEIKYGTDPNKNILKIKSELIEIIRENGYKLRDIEIKVK